MADYMGGEHGCGAPEGTYTSLHFLMLHVYSNELCTGMHDAAQLKLFSL